MERPRRVLAIDVDASTVRGIVLVAGPHVVAGGYAQLGHTSSVLPGSVAARIAAALDVKTELPVVVTCDDALATGTAEAVAAEIEQRGFASVIVVARNESARRANPGGDEPVQLADCDIPTGLLASHPGLTLGDLAPVVGAGLAMLGRGAAVEATSGGQPGAEEHGDDTDQALAVWQPDDDTVDDDTSAPTSTSTDAVGAEPEPTAVEPVPPQPNPTADRSDRAAPSRRGLVLSLLGLVALVLALGIAITKCGGGDEAAEDPDREQADGSAQASSTSTAGSGPAAADTDVAATPDVPEPTAAPEPTASPEPTAAPEPTASPEPTPEPTADPLEGLPPLSSLPERGAIFRPPTLFLQGPVQTQEQADAFHQRAAEVVGPDNVVNEYVIRPDAPPATDGNVRVEQAVLFQSGSAIIAPPFIPVLDLGVLVMALNPQVTMVVEGHTDSVGDADGNQRLSEARAQAVVDYIVSRGIDRTRLQAVGFGESTPVAGNDTEEGRQINRRIEVNLLDLLAEGPES